MSQVCIPCLSSSPHTPRHRSRASPALALIEAACALSSVGGFERSREVRTAMNRQGARAPAAQARLLATAAAGGLLVCVGTRTGMVFLAVAARVRGGLLVVPAQLVLVRGSSVPRTMRGLSRSKTPRKRQSIDSSPKLCRACRLSPWPPVSLPAWSHTAQQGNNKRRNPNGPTTSLAPVSHLSGRQRSGRQQSSRQRSGPQRSGRKQSGRQRSGHQGGGRQGRWHHGGAADAAEDAAD